MGYSEKVVIIGGGISGLACAYRLKQLGVPCLLLEAGERPGGVIASIRRDGFVFELGPQFPRFPASVWRMVRDLHLESEFMAGDKKAKRYIFRNDRLYSAPFSPGALFASPLISLSSKLRFLSEGFRSTQPPAREETLAEFIHRKFGADVLDNLVDPFISTIFFGDPTKMGMQSAFPDLVEWESRTGSLVRGAIRARSTKKSAGNSNHSSANSGTHEHEPPNTLHLGEALPALGTFKSGMGRLTERLAEVLQGQIRYGASVRNIAQLPTTNGTAHSGWQIALSSGEHINAQHMVLAVPAYSAAKLLGDGFPPLSANLAAIEYAPMSMVASAYNRSQVAHSLQGFGFMVPRREGLHTICTFWNSSLFPLRAPEGKVLITTFAGRDRADDSRIDDAMYSRAIEAENARVLSISGAPVDREVWHDPRALPQYNVGHARRIAEIGDSLRSMPNLHLAGNYLEGRSIGDCVDIASRIAEDVHSHVRPNDI